MESRDNLERRPKIVTQIAIYLGVMSICSIVGGATILLLLTINRHDNNGLVWLACVFPILGMIDGILAIAFFRLQKWTYPIVKTLVSNWWLSGPYIGFGEKIKSPEVKQAFGIDHIPNSKE